MQFEHVPFSTTSDEELSTRIEKALRAARVAYRKRIDNKDGSEFIIEVQKEFMDAAKSAYAEEIGEEWTAPTA